MVGAQAPWRHRVAVVGLILCCGVSGCSLNSSTVADAYDIPAPGQSLLGRQSTPKCSFGSPSAREIQDSWTPFVREPQKSASPTVGGGGAPSGPPVSEERLRQVQALMRERDCYQQAEARVRVRLHKLQSAVGRTLGALQENAGERRREARMRR
ncbi:MAG: hypothetical protein ACR2PO_03615 [Methyloligellaceae bacterium]